MAPSSLPRVEGERHVCNPGIHLQELRLRGEAIARKLYHQGDLKSPSITQEGSRSCPRAPQVTWNGLHDKVNHFALDVHFDNDIWTGAPCMRLTDILTLFPLLPSSPSSESNESCAFVPPRRFGKTEKPKRMRPSNRREISKSPGVRANGVLEPPFPPQGGQAVLRFSSPQEALNYLNEFSGEHVCQ
eukprot:TRINITY_DN24344_c0_g1_i1.p1 TRINITY_DN24344_c0_g1~~TRINITY_DN24344_c0_g1_i1.p1  ORF type:complete len:187 (-),score=11.23 TRINITY_DN24344_c0_g1_i1:275-835(-)